MIDQDRFVQLLFHIDTNRINARSGLPSMNQLRMWHEAGVILMHRMRVVVLFACVCSGSLGLPSSTKHEARAAELERPGVCSREGMKLVGMAPIQIDKRRHEPKKIRSATPKYPELPRGTRGSGGWTGEFLLDREGSVAQVWTLREVSFRPAFPPFNQAIVDAITQWKFEPLIVQGQPVPVCTAVTVSIDWSKHAP